MPLLLALALLAAAPDAQALFDAGDFDAALTRIDASLKSTANRPARASLQLLRARCLAALRRNVEVEPAMEAALDEDPTAQFSDDISPGLRATLERTKARLAGTVQIDSDPKGLAVRVNGALVGSAPVTQLLPVGRYELSSLDAAGNPAATRTLVVAPRSEQRVMLEASAPAPLPVAPELHTELPEPQKKAWPIEPGIAVRASLDVLGPGVSLEAGVFIVGRYFVVELDGIYGGNPGAGLRAGGRIPLGSGLLAAQLTADAVAFFGAGGFAPGAGATLSLGVHPHDALDILLDGSLRFVAAAAGYRAQYGLIGLTVRVRWPSGLDQG